MCVQGDLTFFLKDGVLEGRSRTGRSGEYLLYWSTWGN